VEIVMDLGHFRQLQVRLDSGSSLKVFVPKQRRVHVDESVALSPSRYLAFAKDDEPVEMVLRDELVPA
jgi:hypothetical protein